MPLFDHFHPPLLAQRKWKSFHGAWAAKIAEMLNEGGLPPGYLAEPFFDHDGPTEIDIAAIEDSGSAEAVAGWRAWEPTAPARTLTIELTRVADFRVEITTDDGDSRLVAAIELVSPANKDRPSTRRTFAARCAESLRRGCGVAVVDVVTNRAFDLNALLLAEFDAEAATESLTLSAVSYRTVLVDGVGQLDIWPTDLIIGRPLPTIPLWLAGEIPVPLDLEASYSAVCANLRIRQTG